MSAQTLRPIILCADDYAIAPGVSRAILDLIEHGRLSATSCMTTSRFWPEHAQWLKPLAPRADVGLHFVLTDGRPLGAMPGLAPTGKLPTIARLILTARRLDPGEIEAELGRQLDSFEVAFDRRPDYIDGHQHVHQLPVVRDVVLRALRTRLPGAYVRFCDEPVAAIFRRGVARGHAVIVSALGRGLRRQADQVEGNRRFAGVRTFGETAPYRDLFRRYVDRAPSGLLVMCHPGRADADLAAVDPVTHQREGEYAYLRGSDFPADLAAAGVRLARFTPDFARGMSSAAD